MSTEQFLTASRARPSAVAADGVLKSARSNVYGEALVQTVGKPRYALADEGRYFVARNPTPGTGVAGIAAADGLNDAEGLMLLTNDNTDGSRVYLDYLYLRCTAAGTNGTDMDFTLKIDSNSNRYTSGGSAITPVNANMDSSATPGVTTYFGALVTTATTTARILAYRRLRRATIVVAGDEFWFGFGEGPAPSVRTGTLAADSTTNVGYATHLPPVVLGAGDCVWMACNAASQTGATSWEFELGFWVR